ncbi:family 20 glycosylhydrolase [Antarcticibacterium sp. 1MA-6-2]|uniref:family 20 glycosylhydrolase n=1 Tax=Antarcticibacterium sp. 1MA-6-2 TaxID=2908210 RepID=UPI002103F9B1|nr:family 20 glycosylhydrolase [Antarcticibacterium sp. 1MA-6-2]
MKQLVWTEHVLNDEMLDDRFWPRTLAVAEIGWSPDEKRNFEDFTLRVAQQGERLNNMGIHFHPSPEVEWIESEKSNKPGSVFSDFEPGEVN